MKYINSIWAIVIAILFLGCAQKINSEDRWSPAEVGHIAPEDRKTILVEEYTGQRCINCPAAAKILQEVSSAYAPNVITISLHAKRTKQTKAALESELADAYAEKFALPNVVPGIMVNRLHLDKAGQIYSDDRGTWSGLIQKLVNQKATHRVKVEVGAISGRSVTLSVVASKVSSQSTADRVGLAIWVVEDIYEEQQVGGTVEPHFLHHNVLRGALTSDVDYTIGTTHKVSADIPLSVKEVKHAKIVAFVYNQKTDEIYEACIVPLGTGINPDTEEPEEETPGTSEGDIKFYIGDKVVTSGSEFEVNKALKNPDGIIEFESPAIRIVGAESTLKDALLDVFVEKMDHKDEATSGIYSVCLGHCYVLPALQQSYSNKTYTPQVDDFISVHYGLSNPKTKGSYRLRLSIKSNGKEIAYWTYLFNYEPEHVENPGNPETPPVDNPTPPGETPNPVDPSEPLPPSESNGKSNVVAIEFTGQRCGYCIDKMREMNSSAKKLDPNLILVNVQTIWYVTNMEFIPVGNIADTYEQHCGVRFYPSVYINNMSGNGYSGGYEAEQQVNKKPILRSTLQVELTEGNQVSVSCKSEPFDEASKSSIPSRLNVLFWVVQNKMSGYQANVQGVYEHNHILRGSLNGAWGETYTLGASHKKVYDLPPVNKVYPPEGLQPSNRFNLQNCEVIAIFLDADTKQFYDAVKVKMTK